MVHVFFMLGVVAFSWGCVDLGLAIGYDPVIAVTTGFTGLFSTLLFMGVTATGITGVPGLTGPPIPARVIMATVAILPISTGDERARR